MNRSLASQELRIAQRSKVAAVARGEDQQMGVIPPPHWLPAEKLTERRSSIILTWHALNLTEAHCHVSYRLLQLAVAPVRVPTRTNLHTPVSTCTFLRLPTAPPARAQ